MKISDIMGIILDIVLISIFVIGSYELIKAILSIFQGFLTSI